MYLYTFVFKLRHTIIIDIDLSITYLFTSLTVDGLGLRFGEKPNSQRDGLLDPNVYRPIFGKLIKFHYVVYFVYQ